MINNIQAHRSFQRLRDLEPQSLFAMDTYAYLLFSGGGSEMELGSLASTLLEIDKGFSQGWAAAALYCDRRGDPERALAFIDNAIRLSPQSSMCYRLKGLLLLGSGATEQAVVCFRQANGVRFEPDNYAGLVRALLDLGHVKEARISALEAVDGAPKSSLAHTLLGKVLEKSQRLSDCLHSYTRALSLNSANIPCALSMADVLIALDRKEEAVQILQATVHHAGASPSLRLALGKAYHSLGRFGEALEQLQMCIRSKNCSPNELVEAQAEVEKAESALGLSESDAYSLNHR